jgi:hypothetical protein
MASSVAGRICSSLISSPAIWSGETAISEAAAGKYAPQRSASDPVRTLHKDIRHNLHLWLWRFPRAPETNLKRRCGTSVRRVAAWFSAFQVAFS